MLPDSFTLASSPIHLLPVSDDRKEKSGAEHKERQDAETSSSLPIIAPGTHCSTVNVTNRQTDSPAVYQQSTARHAMPRTQATPTSAFTATSYNVCDKTETATTSPPSGVAASAPHSSAFTNMTFIPNVSSTSSPHVSTMTSTCTTNMTATPDVSSMTSIPDVSITTPTCSIRQQFSPPSNRLLLPPGPADFSRSSPTHGPDTHPAKGLYPFSPLPLSPGDRLFHAVPAPPQSCPDVFTFPRQW